ncbi:MAG: alpha/beta hydrolase [Anaerolineae bacterium]
MGQMTKAAWIGAGTVAAAALLGPFLVPVPPLEGTAPADRLADADGRFVDVDGLRVYCRAQGQGQRTFMLLHGFAASAFSWRDVMTPLAEMGRVIAYDRPGFGLTSRPMPGEWRGDSPYGIRQQARLVIHLMDTLGVEKAVLVGNSAGGTLAVLAAALYPNRVQALILVAPAIYAMFRVPAPVRWFFATPQMRHLGPLLVRPIERSGLDFARSAWHNPEQIADDVWAGYTLPLQAENWDRGLWEITAANQSLGRLRLSQVTTPTLVITGDDDRIVRPEQSVRVANEMPNARLVMLPNCGHLPHEECPAEFMRSVRHFVAELPQA